MERAVVDGITLEYVVASAGEPVVLIHGALIADAFRLLLAEPGLAEVLAAFWARHPLPARPLGTVDPS